MEGPELFTSLLLAFALFGTVRLLTPIATAFARRLEGRGGSDALHEEVEALRERVGEVEALRERVMELEERVDFTERVLGREADAARLSPPGGP